VAPFHRRQLIAVANEYLIRGRPLRSHHHHLPSIFRFIIIIATMSKQPSYCPIRNYFKTHALELSDEKRTKLVDEWGYDTVESLGFYVNM